MNVFPRTSIPPHPVSDEEHTVATFRAVSHQRRSRVVPQLTQTLQDCGCWVRERKGSGCGLALTFELSLREIVELYPGLMECGLEFDRRGHCELAMLCTISKHSLAHEALRRYLLLRLEITFADELEAGLAYCVPPCA